MAGSWSQRLMLVGRCVCDSARLMVGVPNYDAYVAHMTKPIPGQPPVRYEAFFRERQDARYGGAGKAAFAAADRSRLG